jgi:ankyrin repeat protein
VDTKDNENMTPLNHAANIGNADAIEVLLDRGANINARKKFGYSSLDLTAIKGNFKAMELLLEHNADIGPNKGDNNTTPLHYAVIKGEWNVIELLIKHGANINAKDNSGTAPIMLAAKKKNVEVMKLLAENGAEISDNIIAEANNIRANLGEELLELYNNFKYLPKTTLSGATVENMDIEPARENGMETYR